MKARIENGSIKTYADVPKDFGHILNFRAAGDQIHREYGFFDLVVPDFSPETHRLGGLYFDQKAQVFTYRLVPIELEEVKQALLSDFEAAKRQTRMGLLEALVDKLIEINRDKLPAELVALYDALAAENQRVTDAIEYMAANDPQALRKFRIDPSDVDGFAQEIQKFKK